MLTIEPPYYLIRGVTIFRDHQDPDQFYFLPGGPQLTTFTLYKYRTAIAADGSDPTRAPGAGMALFEVEVPLPNLTTLTSDLASATNRDKARLSPVMFSSAEVHAIIPRADGDKLFQDLLETHAAPLVSPYHTAFGLALSPEGATFMERAATAPPPTDGDTTAATTAIPVGVVYEMRFLALTQALHARVTMNYVECYNRFSASIGFTYYYIKAALDLDLAWLVEHDFIKIEILAFSDSEDAERQRTLVMDLVTARVQRDFFHSGLPQQQDSTAPAGVLGSLLGAAGGGNTTSGSAMFVLKAKYEMTNQSKDFVLTFDSRTAVELTHTMSAHLSSLAQGKSPLIESIDTGDSFFSRLDVKVLSVVDFNALADLRDAVVNVSFGDVRNSYPLSAQAGGPFAFAAALANPAQDQYSYDAQYDFDLDQGQGPARLSAGPFTSRSRVLVVDPLLHFRYREVRFVLGPMDPALVPRVHVRVRVPGADPGAPDLAHQELLLDAATPERVFRVHAPLDPAPLRVLARPSWEDAHGQVHDGDESEATSTAFLVLGPYVDVIPLYIAPAIDWTQLSQAIIEVRYQDGDYLLDKTLTFNAAGKGAAQRLQIPLLDMSKRRYSWRWTLFKLDGTSTQTDFADADSSVLAPTSIVKTTADVRVAWVGAPGDALGLRVDLWAQTPSGDEQAVSAFLRAGESDKVVTLPLDGSGKLTYRYQATKISASGETPVRSATDQSSPLVVLQTN